MNKQLDFSHLAGLHFTQKVADFMQQSFSQAVDAFAAGMGENWVLTGCVDTGANITDGWIFVGGEAIPFTGGAIPATPKVLVTTVVTKEQYNDGVQKNFYTNKTASLVSVAADGFDYAELKRLPDGGIMKNIADLHEIVRLAINLEDAIILSGCAVSAVNTGLQICTIAPGKALLDGQLVDAPAYTAQTYPVYLTVSGWTNSLPAPGIKRIMFDPYTSQHYRHVLRRQTTSVDEIKHFKTLSTSFVAGVGRWDMLGFSLMAEMQARTPVGLWFDGNPVENVTDANFTGAGNQGGFKTHTLTADEVPETVTEIPASTDGSTGTSGLQYNAEFDVNVPFGNNGGGQAHNNMQPYTVIVYAIRTA